MQSVRKVEPATIGTFGVAALVDVVAEDLEGGMRRGEGVE